MLQGCHDPNPIVSMEMSPDGKHAAVLWVNGRLGVIRLNQSGGKQTGFKIFPRYARGRMGWNPDSSKLVFLEHVPQNPPSMVLLDINQQNRLPALLTDVFWKDRSVWLESHRVAYLSTGGSDQVGGIGSLNSMRTITPPHPLPA
jgi:hypothetical protein